ncbi:MAG: tetratricopeptide repeat protein [Desulfobacteraceae bacterium]|nr:tetratricopeptide repeat protein [Desulfobacteraceae bacterium]
MFDTPRFARNLEKAYLEMWRAYQAGETPRPIHVSESSPLERGRGVSIPESNGSGLTTDQAFIQMAHYNNMGTTLQAQRRTDEAIAYFKKALEIMPDFTAIYNNLGLAYSDKGNFDEALKSFQKVIEADPNYSKAYYNMGNLYQSRGFLDDAIRCYRKAIELEPDYVKAYSSLFHRLRYICEWKDLPQMTAMLDRIANESFAKGERCDETPFINITRDTNPHRNFVVAKAWGDEIAKRMESFKKEVNFNVTLNTSHITQNSKLRIGYISADFRNHPVAHLMLELFGAHNRQEFEIFCYSYSEDNGGHYRKHIEQSCDKFVDILRMSYVDAASAFMRMVWIF